jgi:hypothetical protein
MSEPAKDYEEVFCCCPHCGAKLEGSLQCECDLELIYGEDEGYEMQIECPYCNGDGWLKTDGLKVECAECGGTGWE